MSGHSKWSTIKRKKEAQDQKRGALFTKLARAIMVAVKKGGSSDSEMNFALRLAIEKAKTANMPKENIEKAIERGEGKGEGSEELKEIIYEGFGPQKVAILVEALTDNSNRTVSELKKIFERGGGTLASSGSASYLFKKTGLLVVKKRKKVQKQMLKLIDLGAEDVEEAEDAIEVYVGSQKLIPFRDLVTGAGLRGDEMEIMMRPKVAIKIENEKISQKVLSLMETLNAHSDVSKTWANFDIVV